MSTLGMILGTRELGGGGAGKHWKTLAVATVFLSTCYLLVGPLRGVHVTGQSECGYKRDCPRNYDVSGTLFSEDRQILGDWAAKLAESRSAALAVCQNRKSSASSGGYCYEADSGNERMVRKGDRSDVDYKIPASYSSEGAEPLLITILSKLVLCDGTACRLSISDFGAGIGQIGHGLKARHPQIKYFGYDGAANVEEFTNGFVKFIDLTIPVQLTRTDWVISIEVGEHIPHEHEAAMVSNLHAHNCRGILLSWASLEQAGNDHINNHSREYLIHLFQDLGYALNESLTESIRATLLSEGQKSPLKWLARNALLFDRLTKPSGC